MERWRYYRLARIWIKKNPWKGMAVVAITAFGLGLGAYSFLEQYDWGRIIINLVFTMLSSEASSASFYAQGKPFWVIVGFIIAADFCNVMIDLFLVNRLLTWRFTRSKIDWINRQLVRLLGKIKKIWPVKGKRLNSINGITSHIEMFRNHINVIRKNPSKAGLSAVMLFATTPRLPFMIIGGVSLGVLILRYNKFGYRGWIALCIGILIRTSVWLGSVYGVSSIF